MRLFVAQVVPDVITVVIGHLYLWMPVCMCVHMLVRGWMSLSQWEEKDCQGIDRNSMAGDRWLRGRVVLGNSQLAAATRVYTRIFKASVCLAGALKNVVYHQIMVYSVRSRITSLDWNWLCQLCMSLPLLILLNHLPMLSIRPACRVSRLTAYCLCQ